VSPTVSIQNSTGSGLDLHSLALPVGYLGAALGVATVIPQIVRTVRNPALPGVSAASWGLFALASLSWLLYGVRADEVPQLPGNLLMVIGSVMIVLAVPSTVGRAARAVRFGLPAVALIALAWVLPASVIGMTAFAIGLVAALPQLVRSFADDRSAASAVSVSAWVLRGASQVSWLAYALLMGDIVVAISAIVGLVGSAVLVVNERQRPPAVAVLVPDALSNRDVEPVEARV